MDTQMEPFSKIMKTARKNSESRRLRERVKDLASQIDELAIEMGSGNLRVAMREYGYDIDGDTAAIGRRGVNIS